MPQDFQRIQATLLHIASHLRKSHDGVFSIPIEIEQIKQLDEVFRELTGPDSAPIDSACRDLIGQFVRDLLARIETHNAPAPPLIYQFRVAIKDQTSLAWRRIQVEDSPLTHFCSTLLALTTWDCDEDFELKCGRRKYVHAGRVRFDDVNLASMSLSTFLCDNPPPKDFSLVHLGRECLTVAYESCHHRGEGEEFPKCLDGEGEIPPEFKLDCLAGPNDLRGWVLPTRFPAQIAFESMAATTAMRSAIEVLSNFPTPAV